MFLVRTALGICLSAVLILASAQDAAALLERSRSEGPVWAQGDTLTFVYEGEADSVRLCCGLQESLRRLPESDVWTLSKSIPDLSEGAFSYAFIVDDVFPQSFSFWRGEDAPALPERLESLTGEVSSHTLESIHLGESREIFVYIPPDYEAAKLLGLPVVYLADGASVFEYAHFVEPLINEGALPQMLLVGIESGTSEPDEDGDYSLETDMRAREYIPDEADERFFEHERFVLEEVLPWAQTEFGASAKRSERIVYGHSNGGVFAAAMGIRNPDVFGYALPFSVGVDPTDILDYEPVETEFYFVAGTLEEGFFSSTQALAERLAADTISVFKKRVAGHDFVMWEEEFPKALLWVFGR